MTLILGSWPLQRVLLTVTGLGYLIMLFQSFQYHSNQHFRHWSMYLPVLLATIIAITSLGWALVGSLWLFALLTPALALGTIGGFAGTYYHYIGVGNRLGNSPNQEHEPKAPVILPVMFSALGLLGSIVLWAT